MVKTEGRVGEEHWGTQTGFRARRLAKFVSMLDAILAVKERVNLLDIGGNTEYWLDLEPVWRWMEQLQGPPLLAPCAASAR